MFRWWNNLFGAGYGRLVEKQAEMDAYDVEVKPEQAVVEVKDISEPVVSFIECMKENPKRFKYKKEMSLSIVGNTVYHTLCDFATKQEWTLYVQYYSYMQSVSHPHKTCFGWPEFLTEDEKEYLYDKISGILNERHDRKLTLKKQRKERDANKERQRLMTVYCKGDNK